MADLILLDPALRSPEVGAYDDTVAILSRFQRRDGFSISGLKFVLPFLCNQDLARVVAGREVAGIVALGSFANVTDQEAWVERLASALRELVFVRRIPFLGICFSHQLLAHMVGGKVDFLRDRVKTTKWEGAREIRLIHPKLQLLFASRPEHGSARELACREAFAAAATWGAADWERLAHPSNDLAERVSKFLRTECPDRCSLSVSHEQEVWSAGELVTAATSSECAIDGLVHPELPIFAVQGHPERPHPSGDGVRLIENFIEFCAIHFSLSGG